MSNPNQAKDSVIEKPPSPKNKFKPFTTDLIKADKSDFLLDQLKPFKNYVITTDFIEAAQQKMKQYRMENSNLVKKLVLEKTKLSEQSQGLEREMINLEKELQMQISETKESLKKARIENKSLKD